jgi:hypothetical protein
MLNVIMLDVIKLNVVATIYYPVMMVTMLQRPMISKPSISPACPMTQVRRRKSMTPQWTMLLIFLRPYFTNFSK